MCTMYTRLKGMFNGSLYLLIIVVLACGEVRYYLYKYGIKIFLSEQFSYITTSVKDKNFCHTNTSLRYITQWKIIFKVTFSFSYLFTLFIKQFIPCCENNTFYFYKITHNRFVYLPNNITHIY